MEHAYTIYPDTDKNTTDGIKYIFDKKWVHIRKSGTEPIIRVYAEAKTQDDADQLCDKTIKKADGDLIKYYAKLFKYKSQYRVLRLLD